MLAWNCWVPTERTFVKFCAGEFYSELYRKFNFVSNCTKITGTLEDLCDLMTLSCCILCELRKFYNNCSRENQNTRFVSHRFFRRLRRLRCNSKKCKGTREIIYIYIYTHTQRFVVVYLVISVVTSHSHTVMYYFRVRFTCVISKTQPLENNI